MFIVIKTESQYWVSPELSNTTNTVKTTNKPSNKPSATSQWSQTRINVKTHQRRECISFADAKFGVFTSQWFKKALKTNARHALLIFLRSELREAAVFSQCAAVITDATVKKRPSNTDSCLNALAWRATRSGGLFFCISIQYIAMYRPSLGGGLAY